MFSFCLFHRSFKLSNPKSCETCIYSLKPLPLYKIRITSEMIENIMDLIALILSKIRG